MAINIARRKFIAALGGTAVAWPLAARAQQPKRVRRIGVLMTRAADDPDGRALLGAFVQGLQEAGWADGRNVEIDTRWAAGDAGLFRKYAAELVALEPDVLLAPSTPAVKALQASATVPIVFVAISDPIGSGFVESFSRPGGNITGFTNFEATVGGKWLELLKEIAPSVKHASMLFNPETANAGASGGIYLQSIEDAAHVQSIELIASPVHNPADIDDVFAGIAQSSDGGLIVMPNAFTFANRERIVAQAARYQIPTVYPLVMFVKAGGLLSYGVDTIDLYRRAVSYVDLTHLVIDGVLAAPVMDFVGGTIDIFGSPPDIVVNSGNLGLTHPVGPHDPGAEPLRMIDQDVKRRTLDGNARSLEPDTQLSENIVNEALIARVVCQPVHNVAVRMRGDGINIWRHVHTLLLSSDLDRRHKICRVFARRHQWSPPSLLRSLRVAYNWCRRLLADPVVYDAAQDTPYKRGHDEQPKLADGPTSYKKGRTDAASGINRRIGYGNADQVDQCEAQPYCNGRKADRCLSVRRAHDNE
jgi:putative tryptophan/tyrosine transport system substrate-binding protein